MDLSGKGALVTGGSGDLGRAIAMRLASRGAWVAITYANRRDLAEGLVSELRSTGVGALAVQLDQATTEDPPQVIQAVIGSWGRLDILVNNAAWNIGVPFPDLEAMTPDLWDRIHATNLRGPFLLARAGATHLRAGGGRILNIASVAGLNPDGSSIAYATAKAGLIHLTRCLAVALAPDVAVNCIEPGFMDGTRMAARVPPSVAATHQSRALLGRTASCDDVAGLAVAICSSEGATGQVIAVDGGMFVHS